jgi:hypothetical protein
MSSINIFCALAMSLDEQIGKESTVAVAAFWLTYLQ